VAPARSTAEPSYNRVRKLCTFTRTRLCTLGSTPTIPAQRDANQRKAIASGTAIVAELIDAGESAKSADRPDLQRMLRYLAELV
jgi:DNA invertase Pin-like site-specific DNA recombinase